MLLSYHNNMICIVFISRTGLCILIQVEITEDNTLYTPSYLPHALLHPNAGPLSWEVPTPASFNLSAALLKKACKTFTSSKHPEREKLKQPPTLSILKSLGGMCHSEWCSVSYDPLPSCGIIRNPLRHAAFPKADGQGKSKGKNEDRLQGSGRAVHILGPPCSINSLHTNSRGVK